MTVTQPVDAALEQRTKELVQVGHVLNMLAALPSCMSAADLPLIARVAGMESFAINTRLAFEFFFGRRDHRDYRWVDYAPGWTPPDDVKTSLAPWYGFATEHCAHLARKRVNPSGAFTVAWKPEEVATLVATVFDLADDFANSLIQHDPDLGTTFKGFVSTARDRASTASTAVASPDA